MKIINKCGAKLVLIFSAILVFPLVFASDDFISSEDFLRRVFVGEIPQLSLINI